MDMTTQSEEAFKMPPTKKDLLLFYQNMLNGTIQQCKCMDKM